MKRERIFKGLFVCLLASFGLAICAISICNYLGIEIVLPAWITAHLHPITGFSIAGVTAAPFVPDSELTAISIASKHKQFIADEVLPRKQVKKENFKYLRHTIQSSTLKTKSKSRQSVSPNHGEIRFTEESTTIITYGFDATISIADINKAPHSIIPGEVEVEFLTKLNALDREIRVANMVFNKANYAAGNKMILSGESQFSHANSRPIEKIQAAIKACFYRPNKAVMSRAVWNDLSQHADVITECHYDSDTEDIDRQRAFADRFELDEIHIGIDWYKRAKPGEFPEIVKVWDKCMLFYFTCPAADNLRGLTFGITAEFGTKLAGRGRDDKNTTVRQGESVRELILAPDLGFLISSAVA